MASFFDPQKKKGGGPLLGIIFISVNLTINFSNHLKNYSKSLISQNQREKNPPKKRSFKFQSACSHKEMVV